MEESKYFYEQTHQMDRWVGLNTTAVEFIAQKKLFHRLIVVTLVLLAGILIVFLASKQIFGFTDNSSIQSGQMSDHDMLVREIQTIKNQFGMLLVGSIENKVNSIEQKIRLGTVSRKDIILIQGLKNDLKILKSQTFNSFSTGTGFNNRHTGDSTISSRLSSIVEKESLAKEISNLYNFVYVGFASFGLIFTAVGGLWVRNYCLIKHLDSRLSKTSFLIENKHP